MLVSFKQWHRLTKLNLNIALVKKYQLPQKHVYKINNYKNAWLLFCEHNNNQRFKNSVKCAGKFSKPISEHQHSICAWIKRDQSFNLPWYVYRLVTRVPPCLASVVSKWETSSVRWAPACSWMWIREPTHMHQLQVSIYVTNGAAGVVVAGPIIWLIIVIL